MVNWKKYLIPAGLVGGLVALGILSAPKPLPPEVTAEITDLGVEYA